MGPFRARHDHRTHARQHGRSPVRSSVDAVHGHAVHPVQHRGVPDGLEDPVLKGMPRTFTAFTGHKEAIRSLPAHAVTLASSSTCPVHAFRLGRNVYAIGGDGCMQEVDRRATRLIAVSFAVLAIHLAKVQTYLSFTRWDSLGLDLGPRRGGKLEQRVWRCVRRRTRGAPPEPGPDHGDRAGRAGRESEL